MGRRLIRHLTETSISSTKVVPESIMTEIKFSNASFRLLNDAKMFHDRRKVRFHPCKVILFKECNVHLDCYANLLVIRL